MAYSSPRTWVVGEVVTASIMNTHVRDNLLALATTGGLVLHEAGGLEIDISAIDKGGLIRGTGVGTMAILTVGADGQVFTSQADGSVAWEDAPGTREFTVPFVSRDTNTFGYSGIKNTFPVGVLGLTSRVNAIFALPADFTTLVEAVVLVIPDATETIQWDLDLQAGAAGELHTNIINAVDNATQDVTINELEELDVSGVFTGVAANDYIGFEFGSDTASIRTVCLRIKYT